MNPWIIQLNNNPNIVENSDYLFSGDNNVLKWQSEIILRWQIL